MATAEISYDALQPGDDIEIVVRCRISEKEGAICGDSVQIVIDGSKGFLQWFWLHRPAIIAIRRQAGSCAS